MFDKFTGASREAVGFAQRCAASFGWEEVDLRHLLLGVLRDEDTAAAIAAVDVNVIALANEVSREISADRNPTSGSVSRFSWHAREVLKVAVSQGNPVHPGHLMFGLLTVDEDLVLNRSGAPVEPRMFAAAYVALARNGSDVARQGERSRFQRGSLLEEFGVDLVASAEEGLLDPVIGRDDELERVLQVLSRRRKSNPLLVGDPGVGKTAVVEGLAQRLASGDVPDNLAGKRIWSIDFASMLAGTRHRGDFEERVKGVLEEIVEDGDAILFVDEIHALMGAGSTSSGALGASDMLKPMLARGEFMMIGATTTDEFRQVEADPAFERRFQPVWVLEPSRDQAVAVLERVHGLFAEHHGVSFADGVFEAAVDGAIRYVPDRRLPDKAIDLIDEAGALVAMRRVHADDGLSPSDMSDAEKLALVIGDRGAAEELRKARLAASGGVVTIDDVAAVLETMTGVPASTVSSGEAERLLGLESKLSERMVGQTDAVSAVARAVRRSRAGFGDPSRPSGSFLFLGPTGVGKTELAKTLAEALFGSQDALITFDMSEYMEKHSVSRLTGAPPGYVGFEEGGQLTEAVRRRPYSVVLFDEVEKAHPDVFDVLLQVLEEGRLTDSSGRKVDFSNTMLVLTSNLGAVGSTRQVGFGAGGAAASYEKVREAALRAAGEHFRPEFLNRLDETVVFTSLGRSDMSLLAVRMLDGLSVRLGEVDVRLLVSDEAIELIAANGFDAELGARPLRRAVQRLVEDEASIMLLEGRLSAGDVLSVGVVDGELSFAAEPSSVAVEELDVETVL